MSVLDLIVALVLLLTVVRGLMTGFINTLFSLAAWMLAFWLGKWGATSVEPLLPLGLDNPAIRYFAGFALVFLVLAHVLATLIRAIGLGAADRVMGGAIGLVKGLVILTGFTLLAGLTSLTRTDFWKQAALSDSLQAMAQSVLPWVSADVAKQVRFE